MFRLIIVISLFLFCGIQAQADTIRIGLRAHSGVLKGLTQWQPTAEYLSEKIPEHTFVMEPYVGLQELMDATSRDEFDFVLTNPSSSVEMEYRFGVTQMVTLKNRRQGKPYTKFGSVIFTRANRDDINTIQDLKGKSFIAVSERAFGGWRVAWREILRGNIDPHKDFSILKFSGGIQEDVVFSVLNSSADAGVVRTDMLERMAERGEINLDDIKVINTKTTEDFPFYHSTQLYPEWPFSKLNKTSSLLAQRVALALLTMPENHKAAEAGKYVGWTITSDYQPVQRLLEDLNIEPFDRISSNTLTDFIDRYWVIILLVIAGFIVVFSVSVYVMIINRKLQASQAELENRVAERTSDFEKAKNIAEQANKAKSEFLSKMSHELRTPMNAVLGFSQLLLADSETPLEKDHYGSVLEIKNAGDHLLGLINEILDISRIEAGKYEINLGLVSVWDIFKKCVSLITPLANEKQVTLVAEVPEDNCTIVTDEKALKQVLINLMSNAVKYNRPNGQVTIKSTLNDDKLVISIIDTGVGIPEDQHDKLFNVLERFDADPGIEGTGIGLAVTKGLVTLLGGKIAVESVEGEGSHFWVELPIHHSGTQH